MATAEFWSETTGALFEEAPYHDPGDPLDRILAYINFRRELIAGPTHAFTCLAGTMLQEVHATSDDIRAACGAAILEHAETLEADIEAAIASRGIIPDGWSAPSLARHTQAVIQGAFILAKSGDDAALAREHLDHLARYVRYLFGLEQTSPTS